MKKLKTVLCAILALIFVFAALSCSQQQTSEQPLVIEDDVMSILFAAIDKTFSSPYDCEIAVSVSEVRTSGTHITTDGTYTSIQTEYPDGTQETVYTDGEWDYLLENGENVKKKSSGAKIPTVLDVGADAIGRVFRNGEVSNAVNALILKGSVAASYGGKAYSFDYVKGDLDQVADKLGEVAGILENVDSGRVTLTVNGEGYLQNLRCDLYGTVGQDSLTTSVSLEVFNPGELPTVNLPEDLSVFVESSAA